MVLGGGIKNKIVNNPLVKNIAVVTSGAAGAQLITVLFSPILTRLYGPEAFGIAGLFVAILTISTPLAGLTYPIAIVLPKEDFRAAQIAKLSILLGVSISSLFFLSLLLVGETIVLILDSKIPIEVLMMLPLSVMLTVFLQVLQQWSIRKKLFKLTAKAAVYHSLSINLLKTSIGVFNSSGLVLVILSTFGIALHLFFIFIGLKKQAPVQIKWDDSKEAKKVLFEYKDFPTFRAPQVALNAFSQSLPVLLLAVLFGAAAAGYYSLGRAVIGVPATLIGKAVGNVFYPRVTEAINKGDNVYRLILHSTVALAAIGLIPCVCIIIFGPQIFSFIFGHEWVIAGEYASWLVIWLYFGFVNRPSVASIPAIREQKWLLKYEILSTGAKVLSLILGFYFFQNELIAVSLFAGVGTVAYLYLIFRTILKAKVYRHEEAS